MSSSSQERQHIRRKMRQQRRALSIREQNHCATQIKKIALAHFSYAKHVAFYLAHDGEIDPAPLVKALLQRGKHCYLPCLNPINTETLWFLRFKPDVLLKRNRYGIPEPDLRRVRKRSAKMLSIVFVPLVAFDLKGNRLGMGKGYYDRTFAFLSRNREFRGVTRLVGLAYEFQKVEHLEKASWDVPLDAIITEKQIYFFTKI